LDEQFNPTPIGAPGELCLTGDSIARGYLNHAELTAERFAPDPFARSKGNRVYRTGDLARYRADGNIEFLGRLDNQVKIRGHRIELGEIESALRQKARVAEAVALYFEQGAAAGRLVAYVVLEQSGVVTVEEMRSYLRERLPEYMVPAVYVILESIPLTPNGKVDRRSLPPPDLGESDERQVAPRTEVEKELARIWSEVLGLERVGVLDNFFDLGGHSLLVTQMTARVNSRFSAEVPLRSFIQSPTIAGLAEIVEHATAAGALNDKTPVIGRVSRGQYAAATSEGRLIIDETLRERLNR
jgi:hypothetical protein